MIGVRTFECDGVAGRGLTLQDPRRSAGMGTRFKGSRGALLGCKLIGFMLTMGLQMERVEDDRSPASFGPATSSMAADDRGMASHAIWAHASD